MGALAKNYPLPQTKWGASLESPTATHHPVGLFSFPTIKIFIHNIPSIHDVWNDFLFSMVYPEENPQITDTNFVKSRKIFRQIGHRTADYSRILCQCLKLLDHAPSYLFIQFPKRPCKRNKRPDPIGHSALSFFPNR